MILVVTGVSTMIHLYSVSYMERGPRLRALLRLPQLLRLLDAAAGARRQLPAADRRLGVRRRRLLPADLLLVPAHDRHARRDQGVRDQRRRRRRPGARHLLHLQAHRHARIHEGRSPPRRTSSTPAKRDITAGCLLLLVGAVRQVRADPAAHLAARRDGGPDPGLRADPRRDDGDRRRLPDRAHAPALRTRPRRAGHRRHHRRR